MASRPEFPFFFFNDTATTEIYTLSLHDALPISNIFPERFSILYAVLQDRPHTFMTIYSLRLRKPAGRCTLAQCTTADTINFPIANHLSAGIKGFHAHSIGMKCRDLF